MHKSITNTLNHPSSKPVVAPRREPRFVVHVTCDRVRPWGGEPTLELRLQREGRGGYRAYAAQWVRDEGTGVFFRGDWTGREADTKFVLPRQHVEFDAVPGEFAEAFRAHNRRYGYGE